MTIVCKRRSDGDNNGDHDDVKDDVDDVDVCDESLERNN